MTVKVIEYLKFGEPFDVYKYIEVADPTVQKRNEVLVAVEASSINPADLLMIQGGCPGSNSLLARQGIEGVGHIIGVGSDVGYYI